MQPTRFQSLVQDKLRTGRSLLLVAPTGIGKTYAVTGDLEDNFRKVVYGVPLRALGGGIRDAIADLNRQGSPIRPVVHHGSIKESSLFGEEVVVTTYDQIVCAAAGLPLSLPLRAGHAVAAALLMSRLILDEAHLAWAISDQALAILLAIINTRQKLGLQTVVLTATLPHQTIKLISETLGLEAVVMGEGEAKEDEGLALRNENRCVNITLLKLNNKKEGDSKNLDWHPVDEKLREKEGKRIYFANTVERIQDAYDRLTEKGVDPTRISVLHNRMPSSWRAEVEEQVHERFGKSSLEGDWILLTNQVAEAGLDISAPLVISDPAPVDTLVQRAGRCARWFREGKTEGEFIVISAPKANMKELALPYREGLVQEALKHLPTDRIDWTTEMDWIGVAWGGGAKEAEKAVRRSLNQTDFALNLFDRAAQNHRPGEIAAGFREILSVDVAVEDISLNRDLQGLLVSGQRPATSSVSLNKGWELLRNSKGKAQVIRYEDGDTRIKDADYLQLGDTLIIPSTVGYLHGVKGLCFSKPAENDDLNVVLSSEWMSSRTDNNDTRKESGQRQTLIDHSRGVMEGVHHRLTTEGAYLDTLRTILKSLEPEKDEEQLAMAIAQIATLAAGFHDLGKADHRWQNKVRAIDPGCPDALIGRTIHSGSPIGIPHTPPGYLAILATCRLLVGVQDSTEHLIRSIALATVRHHSSLLNPAQIGRKFEPSTEAKPFVQAILREINAPDQVVHRASEIINAAQSIASQNAIPLALPNDDLFPIYALVGRAVMMADREDAAGKELEKWRAEH